MSAFAVIWRLDGSPAVERELCAMLDRLAHRGTGAAGKKVSGSLAFGFLPGYDTPESLFEDQPIGNFGSSTVFAGDVRLDNREELLALVGEAGSSRTVRDAALVRLCYEKLGEDCFSRLLGDFAFAIWDSRKRRLLCVRDSMGVKHFYYIYRPGKLFALASEAKALFELDDVSLEVDRQAIGDYLIFNYLDKESTLFKGVKRLPANSLMTVDRDGIGIRQYWKPREDPPKGLRSSQDFEEAFRDILVSSIAARTRGSRAVASMLSGGLDSSTITCVAGSELAAQGKPAIKSYSAIFPDIAKQDDRIDERRFIDSVIAHSGCDPVFVTADSINLFSRMRSMHESADHPVGAPNVFMDMAIFEAAAADGTKVLLSGFDGDSAISYGYEGFEGMARNRQFVRLFRSARQLERNMPSRHHEFRKLVWNRGLRPAVPDFVRLTWRFLNRIELNAEEVRELPSQLKFCHDSLRPEFAREHYLKERYFALMDKNQPERDSPAAQHWDSLSSGVLVFALETFEKVSAAFGIEQRYPFFDRRLIEFCSRLPAWQKVQGGWTRSIIRRSTSNILPEDVRWRTDKANIGISFKLNLHRFGTEEMKEALFDRPEVIEPFVDIEKLRDSYRRFVDDPLRYEGEPLFLNSCVNLSNWLRTVEREASASRSPAPAAKAV
ncbi:MAG: hypothetical protein IPM63_03390 [Acidobacteriota bacterium]|nr:MAG: hypothetical protein IPM63_03390 [Acidobacteriota bacterium]